MISGDLEALQEYGEALRRRRQAMGGRQDEVIKQHEGNVMMQKDLEAAREEVARMAKEAVKASQREEELKEEVEKLRQGMHQILESVREQVLAQLFKKLINFVPGWSERCDGDSTRPRDPPDHSRRAALLRGVPAKHGAEKRDGEGGGSQCPAARASETLSSRGGEICCSLATFALKTRIGRGRVEGDQRRVHGAASRPPIGSSGGGESSGGIKLASNHLKLGR